MRYMSVTNMAMASMGMRHMAMPTMGMGGVPSAYMVGKSMVWHGMDVSMGRIVVTVMSILINCIVNMSMVVMSCMYMMYMTIVFIIIMSMVVLMVL